MEAFFLLVWCDPPAPAGTEVKWIKGRCNTLKHHWVAECTDNTNWRLHSDHATCLITYNLKLTCKQLYQNFLFHNIALDI